MKPNVFANAKPNARNSCGFPEREKSVDEKIAEAVEENEELTQQQRDFCLYYTRNRNATQAYFKAYECSYNTAQSNGPALLGKTRIKDNAAMVSGSQLLMNH